MQKLSRERKRKSKKPPRKARPSIASSKCFRCPVCQSLKIHSPLTPSSFKTFNTRYIYQKIATHKLFSLQNQWNLALSSQNSHGVSRVRPQMVGTMPSLESMCFREGWRFKMARLFRSSTAGSKLFYPYFASYFFL